MEAKELRKKTQSELNETLRELDRERQKVAKEILQNKEKNVKKLVAIRKDIARVKTVLNQRDTTEGQK